MRWASSTRTIPFHPSSSSKSTSSFLAGGRSESNVTRNVIVCKHRGIARPKFCRGIGGKGAEFHCRPARYAPLHAFRVLRCVRAILKCSDNCYGNFKLFATARWNATLAYSILSKALCPKGILGSSETSVKGVCNRTRDHNLGSEAGPGPCPRPRTAVKFSAGSGGWGLAIDPWSL